MNGTAAEDAERGRERDRLEQARAGNEVALRRIYEEHSGPVMRLAYGLLGDLDEAEDLMQDTMTWGLTHLDRYDPTRAALGTWLRVITRSRAMDRLRQRQRRKRGLAGLFRERRAEPLAAPMADVPARIDAGGSVRTALGELTPKQREALLLHDLEGFSFREIGEQLDISMRTAQSRVLSAHRAFKRALEDRPQMHGQRTDREEDA